MLTKAYTRNLPDIFDYFFGNRSLTGNSNDYTSDVSIPLVNVIEGNEGYEIEVAAPGLSKKDFKIDIENRVLVISSEKKNEKKEKEGNYVRREFGYSSFKRSFTLPDEIDAEKIKASHSEGILNISLPKKAEAKVKGPRTIAIS